MQLKILETEMSPQLGARRFSRFPERQGDEKRADETQRHSQPGGERSILGSVRSLPLGAKIAAAILLTVWASVIVFRTYLADGISNSRRALLNLCGLTLYGLGIGLWMLSAP